MLYHYFSASVAPLVEYTEYIVRVPLSYLELKPESTYSVYLARLYYNLLSQPLRKLDSWVGVLGRQAVSGRRHGRDI